MGKHERIPATHFGKIEDWDKFAPLKSTLDQKALDASDVASDQITSDDDAKESTILKDRTSSRTKEIVGRIDKKIERSNQRKQAMFEGSSLI